MSEEEEEHVFRVDLTLNEYVAQDKAFYIIFQRAEVVRGVDDLINLISVIIEDMQKYLDRRITNISDFDASYSED